MNKDKKIAIILAPFLLVGGYVLSDIYIESKTSTPILYALTLSSECTIFTNGCILQAGDMLVKITDQNGTTKVNTSYPVDTVAISLVYNDGKEIIYDLQKAENPQYWERLTDIRAALTQNKNATTLRLAVKRKGSTYLSEFRPITASE